jgi:hypothetical protein
MTQVVGHMFRLSMCANAVFHAETHSVEDYLKQVEESTILAAIQVSPTAQKPSHSAQQGQWSYDARRGKREGGEGGRSRGDGPTCRSCALHSTPGPELSKHHVAWQ